jgi:HAMP domain-containing protein
MTMIVFIPIVIISMVTFSNTKLNDSMAAVSALDQIATYKSEEIEDWSQDLSDALADLLGTVDNYSKIVELFATHARGELSAELFYRQAVATILIETMNRSGFDEVHLMDSDGIVVTSTHGELIGTDQQYSEFFWQGKLGATILTPRYYPPEDEVSIFVSQPVLDYAGEVIGVLSGRATVERMIEIISVPALQPYQSTLTYMINTDGTLLVTSKGRSETHLQTEGAQSLLTTHENGNGSYTNIDGLPVIGVYRWLPDLKVGIIVEVSEAEVFQRLPGVITSNLAIGVVAFLLAAIAAITIVRTITSPINELVKASQDVVDGNLDIRVETARDDELGILTDSFNKMTSELNTLVTGLETRVAERTRDLEQRSLELQTAAQIARDASMASTDPCINS